MKFLSNSESETLSFAKDFSKIIKAGDIILLNGDLGAGKTTFTKGIAAGLGILEPVKSPSFVIEKIYHGNLKLVHIDMYRIDDCEAENMGFEERVNDKNVLVVEWNKLNMFSLKASYIINFSYCLDNKRSISIEDRHGK